MILPAPGESFTWRDTAFGPALVCTAVEAVASHFFTTRHWALGDANRDAGEAWAEVGRAAGVGANAFVRLRQVHGGATVVAEASQTPRTSESLPDADIVLAGTPDLAVAVQGADCVPLLIADRRLGVVAAAHAGWRGLALGVPRLAVEALAAQYGSRPSDLVAAIGPSVGACCYEVGPEVREAFAASGVPEGTVSGWFHGRPQPTEWNPSRPGLPLELREGHAFFDGWACAREQLSRAGLPVAAVFTARLCTASHPDLLCSYRLHGRRAGRIAGAIRPRAVMR